MKGNGQEIDFVSIDEATELPQSSMEKMQEDSVLPCDFCGELMDFHGYRTHKCKMLQGRNPFSERMKGARWQVPGQEGFVEDTRGLLNGTVGAKGHVVGAAPPIARYLFRAIIVGIILGLIFWWISGG